MQVLREIHQITSNTVTISVPEAFQNHRVEIIVLPLNEIAPQAKPKKKIDWRDKLAQATQIRTQIAARHHKLPLIEERFFFKN
jgi:predicted GTPase